MKCTPSENPENKSPEVPCRYQNAHILRIKTDTCRWLDCIQGADGCPSTLHSKVPSTVASNDIITVSSLTLAAPEIPIIEQT